MLRLARTRLERRTSPSANSSGARTAPGNSLSWKSQSSNLRLFSANSRPFSWVSPKSCWWTRKVPQICSNWTQRGAIWLNCPLKVCLSWIAWVVSSPKLIGGVLWCPQGATSRIILAKFRKTKRLGDSNLTSSTRLTHSCTCARNLNPKKLALLPERKTSFAMTFWITQQPELQAPGPWSVTPRTTKSSCCSRVSGLAVSPMPARIHKSTAASTLATASKMSTCLSKSENGNNSWTN